ncbi:hypothetical protein J40TS1_24440 [Paenibacillus montaniterrae]|uniref:Nucleotide kinase n=1 Tax=Paenibacillus montaniterrae TaxID=429341 RepID=A0A919YLU5_9BACL|nr:hypothetical protein [Paenibacillus montaniterrae]GIP16802.1 hypothetical protein J40TS1_24440 [Paenibacillus montaniterrae]
MTQISYFLSGNTAKGYKSLIQNTLKHYKYLCVVDGPYLSDNCVIMQRLYETLHEDVEHLELVYHPSSPDHLQGIIFPEIKMAVFSSTPESRILLDLHKGPAAILNVFDFYDMKKIQGLLNRIDRLTTEIITKHHQAYRGYEQALRIHDEWEKIYIEQSNFRAANAFADQLAHQLFPDRELTDERNEPIYRFLGAATPKGAIDFVPELTAGLKRYFIKGRPGSGKSTLLRKLVARGEELGYELEVYQCGLDPDSLDMVICRPLGFAIFDSTAPHEYDPVLESDELIDMYQIAIAPHTDERFKAELQEVAERYRAQMKLSNAALAEAASFEEERAILTEGALIKNKLHEIEQILVASIREVLQSARDKSVSES